MLCAKAREARGKVRVRSDREPVEALELLWGFADRGLVREGMAADFVVFDPDTIAPNIPHAATDLPAGAKRLIVTMEHVTKKGEKKILDKCNLPLTGVGVVNRIITDYAVIDVTDKGLKELAALKGLTHLYLVRTQVTGEGLKHLAAL